MFGKTKSPNKGKLPPIGIFSPEAGNRAISYVTPEVIAETWAKYDEILELKFAESVQLKLPFSEGYAQPVV